MTRHCTSQYNSPPALPSGNIPWNPSNAPVNVCRVVPISAAVAAINQSWQGKLAGTVWANYEMVDTLNPAVPGQSPPPSAIPVSGALVNTDTLANTTMETYFQGTGQSCMDCHAYGFPQGAPMTSGNFQVFSFVLGDAATPPPPGTKRLLQAVPSHRQHHLPKQVLDLIQRRTGHR